MIGASGGGSAGGGDKVSEMLLVWYIEEVMMMVGVNIVCRLTSLFPSRLDGSS